MSENGQRQPSGIRSARAGDRPEGGDTAMPRVAVAMTQLGLGGAERQTVELLRRLRGGPWQPALVVCLSDQVEPYGPELEAQGYPMVTLPARSSFEIGRVRALRRLLRHEGIGLVHAVNLLASGYAWLACRRGSRTRAVPTVRRTVVRQGWLRHLVYRRMLRASPVTLVNSHRGARFLEENLGAPADRLEVVPNGVDFGALRERASSGAPRVELGLGPDSRLIGFVGKHSKVKNAPRFLEVVRLLLERHGDLHAVLVGYGLDASARSDLAAGLPEERVHLLGPRRDVPALLAAMDSLVLTSESEGCPNVVLEALGVGTPVVAADVGDVPLILRPGEGSAVVPRADILAYVDAVEAILGSGGAARDAVRTGWPRLERAYSMEAMVEGTLAVWRKAVPR